MIITTVFPFVLAHFCIAAGQVNDTVTLQPVQPTSGLSACPGQDVTLNCTIVRMSTVPEVIPPPLTWQYRGDTIIYNANSPDSSYYTAVFLVVGLTVMSTATINSVLLSHHNSIINCLSPASSIHSETITIAGAANSLSNLSITASKSAPAVLTWLPPPNGPTDCVLNYTINITTTSSSSSSCSMTVYSSNTSLILTDLLTSGQNYSFAVAVTDSTGQYGPWSDQLMVTYDVPGIVSFMIQLNSTNITVVWKPPDGLPVLHYVVSYNTSDNSTVIQTQLSSSISSYTVSSEPGVTYYITVFAVNAVGTGDISEYSIVNVPLLPTITSTTATKISQPSSSSPTTAALGYTIAPSSTNTMPGGETIVIISATIGGIIAVIIFLMVLLTIICFMHVKGKKQKIVSCNSNIYSKSLEMSDKTGNRKNEKLNKKETSIYADLATTNDDDSIPPPRPPPPVNKTTKRGEIIYADLGSVPLHNKPAIPPPPMDRVIYSDVREFKPKKENTCTSSREKPVIYADLGTAPGKRPMAAPLSTHDQIVYSTVNSNIN